MRYPLLPKIQYLAVQQRSLQPTFQRQTPNKLLHALRAYVCHCGEQLLRLPLLWKQRIIKMNYYHHVIILQLILVFYYFSRKILFYFLVTERGPISSWGSQRRKTTKLFSGNTVKTVCGSIAGVSHLGQFSISAKYDIGNKNGTIF